jgi:hypothetical protein
MSSPIAPTNRSSFGKTYGIGITMGYALQQVGSLTARLRISYNSLRLCR